MFKRRKLGSAQTPSPLEGEGRGEGDKGPLVSGTPHPAPLPQGARATARSTGVLPVEHREPEVTAPGPESLSERAPEKGEPRPGRHYWPKDRPLPTSWKKLRQPPPPCPKCRRVTLDTGSQAAACMSSGKGFAYFRCRSCGETWKLAVEEV